MASTVYILGAGASHNAQFRGADRSPPQLLKDFIKVGRQIVGDQGYEPLWQLLERRHGISIAKIEAGDPDLEAIFTILDTTSQLIWHNTEDRYISFFGEDYRFVTPSRAMLSLSPVVPDEAFPPRDPRSGGGFHRLTGRDSLSSKKISVICVICGQESSTDKHRWTRIWRACTGWSKLQHSNRFRMNREDAKNVRIPTRDER